jgi:hypothetical protein
MNPGINQGIIEKSGTDELTSQKGYKEKYFNFSQCDLIFILRKDI